MALREFHATSRTDCKILSLCRKFRSGLIGWPCHLCGNTSQGLGVGGAASGRWRSNTLTAAFPEPKAEPCLASNVVNEMRADRCIERHVKDAFRRTYLCLGTEICKQIDSEVFYILTTTLLATHPGPIWRQPCFC